MSAGFTFFNPFRTDLPAGLRVQFFATADMASHLAEYTAGTAFLENTGAMSGALEPAWFISYPDKKVPWNAGDLYVYLQTHPNYNPAA